MSKHRIKINTSVQEDDVNESNEEVQEDFGNEEESSYNNEEDSSNYKSEIIDTAESTAINEDNKEVIEHAMNNISITEEKFEIVKDEKATEEVTESNEEIRNKERSIKGQIVILNRKLANPRTDPNTRQLAIDELKRLNRELDLLSRKDDITNTTHYSPKVSDHKHIKLARLSTGIARL